jgi:hypothetical protein
VFDQHLPELVARVDQDFAIDVFLEARNRGRDLAAQDRSVLPYGFREGRGRYVLGQTVQPVRPGSGSARPARAEPLVASAAKQKSVGACRFLGLYLSP